MITRREFGPVVVEFDEHVLEPRPWTLLQSERAASRLRDAPAGLLIELHCGAGHIGQAAAVWSGRPLVQVDDDPICCTWAARNAHTNCIPASVMCARADDRAFRDAVAALVIADPPYVPSAETTEFPHDPVHAIDGGRDGLDGLRACIPAAARLLRPGGVLVLQVRGFAQASQVAGLAATDGALSIAGLEVTARDRAVIELVRS